MTALVAIFVSLVVAGAAWAFPQDPPNDPNYAPAEASPAATTCLTKAGDNEQHYLYSKIPQCTPNAQDAEGSAGMFVDKAWHDFTTGNGATIAYVEGGINWHGGDAPELANRVFLNRGELPAPTTPAQGQQACPGQLCAADYSDSPDANHNGVVDPEDLIVRFSNGRDNDHNGYTDDISGWDFYNDQNDPATVDSTYDHANGQMKQAAAETNNSLQGAGVCPSCRVMPVKAGAEALDRTDDLAQAWLYATDMHADVIVSTTADLGYSTFMNQAVDYAWNHGTAMVESSNDFDSTDHQGGMFHQHVLPGNAMVANTHGMDFIPGTTAVQNAATTTYRSRSAYTSWGTHNMFTVATEGGTTSEATPTVGGVVALVLAEGKQAAAQHKISRPLSPDEAIQVLRATSSDVAAPVNAPVNWTRQARLRPSVRLWAPQRLQGRAGGLAEQHPARGLDREAQLVRALRPDQAQAGKGDRTCGRPPLLERPLERPVRARRRARGLRLHHRRTGPAQRPKARPQRQAGDYQPA